MFGRMTWVIFFVIYLLGLTFFMTAIGETYGADTPIYDSLQKSIGSSFVVNLVTGISILGFWLNLFLVGLPSGFLFYIIVTQNTPTTNAGI